MNMNTKEKVKAIEKKLLIVFLNKYRTNTEQKNEQSRFKIPFKKGQSGNPKGRPKGS